MELSPSQSRFYQLLNKYAPYLLTLWDWQKAELKLEMAQRYLATASHGEAVMCRFAVAVWLGQNDFQFDLVDAAGALEREQRLVVAAWLVDPFWP